jgi:hypothetical protein
VTYLTPLTLASNQILLISISWISRITGVSHWHLARFCILLKLSFLVFAFSVVLGFEFRSLPCLQPFFLWAIFQIRSWAFAWLWLRLCLLVSGITGLCHHCPDYCWDGVLLSLCLDWPQTSILRISASWESGIIDVSHLCLKMGQSSSIFFWILFFAYFEDKSIISMHFGDVLSWSVSCVYYS